MQAPHATLYQGTSKKTDEPFTAIRITVGKYTTLQFPSAFERDYVVDYLHKHQPVPVKMHNDGNIIVTLGDYERVSMTESKFARTYIKNYFAEYNTEKASNPEHDDRIDLESDEPTNTGMFD